MEHFSVGGSSDLLHMWSRTRVNRDPSPTHHALTAGGVGVRLHLSGAGTFFRARAGQWKNVFYTIDTPSFRGLVELSGGSLARGAVGPREQRISSGS